MELNEAPKIEISPEERKLRQAEIKQNANSKNSSNKFIPKIDSYISFQKLYNMYVHNELDNFEPTDDDPLGFLRNSNDTKSNNNSRNDNQSFNNVNNMSTDEVKKLYNELTPVFNDRLNLKLKEV